ncbi:MAG: hypothetical protein OQK07_04985 [Rhodospirillales bacterium]|nr:hypothetical protein [Rhodospirillales bacterium]
MSAITSYRVKRNGSLWVHLRNGKEREATPNEWLHLWKEDPALTISLAARN